MSLKNNLAIVTAGNSGVRQEAIVIDYVVHPEATETPEIADPTKLAQPDSAIPLGRAWRAGRDCERRRFPSWR
jgi:hypothetical protein